MSKPDILIGESGNKVVGQVAIGTSRQAVQKSRSEGRASGGDGRWDIQFAPEWATINLGGGDGDHSDGDVKLYDNPESEEAKPLVHLSAGAGNNRHARVAVDGTNADVAVGNQWQSGSISVTDSQAGAVCQLESGPNHSGVVRAIGRGGSSVSLHGETQAVEFEPYSDAQGTRGATYVLEHDGDGIRLGDKDDTDGPSLVLGADDSTVTVEDDDGEAVFEIDTDAETIKTKWEIDQQSDDLQ